MVLESNRDLVVRRLVECLGRDRTKHQVAEVTSLGLVQMTRKRVGQGLLESFSEPCEACGGRGVLVHSEPVDEKKQAKAERFDDRPRSERGGRDRGGRGGGGEEKADKPRAEDKARDDRPAGSADDSEGATPRKRSRGGRGRGGRSEGAPAADTGETTDPVTASVGDVDPAAADIPAPDVTPDLAEQPPTALEDQPVVLEAVEDTPTAANGTEPTAEAGPKRRRRATSRPAGPPTVSV
jgi:ribonuclease E